jgi:nitroreductase
MNTLVMQDALTVIHSRKSVRTFSGKPVQEEDIQTILSAAMAAPSAVDLMPWRFIVVRDNHKLHLLANGLPFAKMLPQAGTCIIVCAIPEDAAMHSANFAVLDCACASQNILLAAEALGLGAVWTAVYPNIELMKFVRNLLSIPEAVIPLNIIPIGHPLGNERSKDKFDKNRIFLEKWCG